MNDDLLFLAGKNALMRIRDGGLEPDDVTIVAGAAGAAKWIAIAELDKAVFCEWLKGRERPLSLYGTSIGSWKLAAAALSDPASGLDTLADSYIHQIYHGRITPEKVMAECRRMLDLCFPEPRATEILSHPVMRFCLSTVRCRGAAGSDLVPIQFLGLSLAYLLNRASRRLLGMMFERAFFHDPRANPDIFPRSEFPTQRVPLHGGNFHRALLATASIPLVMHGIRDIPGASSGVYRDGGILDYHPASFSPHREEGIILYPHFSTRIVPGWFDKSLPARSPDPEHLRNMLVLAPSPDFMSRLPNGRIPDRSDFRTFYGRDRERIAFWREAAFQGKRLAECFMESVLGGSIRAKVGSLEAFQGMKS